MGEAQQGWKDPGREKEIQRLNEKKKGADSEVGGDLLCVESEIQDTAGSGGWAIKKRRRPLTQSGDLASRRLGWEGRKAGLTWPLRPGLIRDGAASYEEGARGGLGQVNIERGEGPAGGRIMAGPLDN